MIITTWIVYIFTWKSVGLPFPPKANSVSGGGSHMDLGRSSFSPSVVLVCFIDTTFGMESAPLQSPCWRPASLSLGAIGCLHTRAGWLGGPLIFKKQKSRGGLLGTCIWSPCNCSCSPNFSSLARLSCYEKQLRSPWRNGVFQPHPYLPSTKWNDRRCHARSYRSSETKGSSHDELPCVPTWVHVGGDDVSQLPIPIICWL